MAMEAFYLRFGDLAFEEMRSAIVRDQPWLPDGEYGFLETYCNETDCDCRRVLIRVVERDSGPRVWATINYGWERPEHYLSWAGRDGSESRMWGAMLDPLNEQSEYAPALLRLFDFVLQDAAYVERLQRHYQIFKAALARPARKMPGRDRERAPAKKRSRRRRCR